MNYDFAPKYWTCPSCKSNNTTKHHHMWSSDLLHFTLYYTLFVPQTSNLFLNISYGSVFLKMCYIIDWCHRNVIHVIELYRIRKDRGGGSSSCWKKKTDVISKFPVPPPPCQGRKKKFWRGMLNFILLTPLSPTFKPGDSKKSNRRHLISNWGPS